MKARIVIHSAFGLVIAHDTRLRMVLFKHYFVAFQCKICHSSTENEGWKRSEITSVHLFTVFPDGVTLSEHSGLSMWPVFLIHNEVRVLLCLEAVLNALVYHNMLRNFTYAQLHSSHTGSALGNET